MLEIGSGHGAAAIAYCAAHPEADLVAVEVHVPGVARMLAAADAAGVTNLWVHPGDALPFLTDRVAPASLAAVHLFFPDPWPKNKHAKRRFVQQHTLDLLASRLVPGGVLRIATDIAAYAAHARTQLAHHGRWDVVEGERPTGARTTGSRPRACAPAAPSPSSPAPCAPPEPLEARDRDAQGAVCRASGSALVRRRSARSRCARTTWAMKAAGVSRSPSTGTRSTTSPPRLTSFWRSASSTGFSARAWCPPSISTTSPMSSQATSR